MKPKNNVKKPVVNGDEIITLKTGKSVRGHEWIIIGGKKHWIRKCNHCLNLMYHSDMNAYLLARRKNRKCPKCRTVGCNNPFFGKHLSDKHRLKLSAAFSGENNPMFGLYGARHPKYGISRGSVEKHSLKSRLQMSKTHRKNGATNGNKNPAKRPDVRRKIRLSVLKHIRENIGTDLRPTFNPRACKYIDGLNQKHGWNLKHALNGGEYFISDLGFWVDGFDQKRNIIFEYDEPKHYGVDGFLKERDVNRMTEIKNHLGCQFFRYNERENKFYEC